MFIVNGVCEGGYKVLDTDDGVSCDCTLDELHGYLSSGITIYGLFLSTVYDRVKKATVYIRLFSDRNGEGNVYDGYLMDYWDRPTYVLYKDIDAVQVIDIQDLGKGGVLDILPCLRDINKTRHVQHIEVTAGLEPDYTDVTVHGDYLECFNEMGDDYVSFDLLGVLDEVVTHKAVFDGLEHISWDEAVFQNGTLFLGDALDLVLSAREEDECDYSGEDLITRNSTGEIVGVKVTPKNLASLFNGKDVLLTNSGLPLFCVERGVQQGSEEVGIPIYRSNVVIACDRRRLRATLDTGEEVPVRDICSKQFAFLVEDYAWDDYAAVCASLDAQRVIMEPGKSSYSDISRLQSYAVGTSRRCVLEKVGVQFDAGHKENWIGTDRGVMYLRYRDFKSTKSSVLFPWFRVKKAWVLSVNTYTMTLNREYSQGMYLDVKEILSYVYDEGLSRFSKGMVLPLGVSKLVAESGGLRVDVLCILNDPMIQKVRIGGWIQGQWGMVEIPLLLSPAVMYDCGEYYRFTMLFQDLYMYKSTYQWLMADFDDDFYDVSISVKRATTKYYDMLRCMKRLNRYALDSIEKRKIFC